MINLWYYAYENAKVEFYMGSSIARKSCMVEENLYDFYKLQVFSFPMMPNMLSFSRICKLTQSSLFPWICPGQDRWVRSVGKIGGSDRWIGSQSGSDRIGKHLDRDSPNKHVHVQPCPTLHPITFLTFLKVASATTLRTMLKSQALSMSRPNTLSSRRSPEMTPRSCCRRAESCSPVETTRITNSDLTPHVQVSLAIKRR